MKIISAFFRRSEALSAVACRLTKLTGKSKYPIHPKHLLKKDIWYMNKLKKNDIILDLGCGVGQDSLIAARKVKKVIGTDIDPKIINIARSFAVDRGIKNVEFLVADANKKLQFKDQTFTKIVCSDVLEHLNRRDFALKEMVRILKPKGSLFLVTDNPNTSWKKELKKYGIFYYADRDHKYEYPLEEISSKLEKNKLSITLIQTVSFDTPYKGFIDLVGGISLRYYKKLQLWKARMVKKYPNESTGYLIIAQKV